MTDDLTIYTPKQQEMIKEAQAAGNLGRAQMLMNLKHTWKPGESGSNGRTRRKPYEEEVIRQATPDKVEELVKSLFKYALGGDMKAMLIIIELLDDRKTVNKIDIHESNVMLT